MNLLSLIFSVGLAVVAAFAVMSAISATLPEGDEAEDDKSSKSEKSSKAFAKRFSGRVTGLDAKGVGISVGAGLFLGVINYVTPMIGSAVVVAIFLGLMAVYFLALCFWWKEKVESWGEMLPCLVLAFLGFLVTLTVAGQLAHLVQGMPLLASVVMTLPTLMLIAVATFFALSKLNFEADFNAGLDAAKERLFRIARNVTAVVAAVAIVLVCVFVPNWGQAIMPQAQQAFAGEEVASIQVTEEEYNAQAANALYESMGVSDELSNSSLTAKDEERVKATGISDALTFPMTAGDDAGKMNEVYREVMANPVYCLTIIKALKDEKIGDQTVGDWNPWMGKAVAQETEHGVLGWCEYRGDDKSKVYLTQEYRQTATATVALLKRFVVQGVQNRTTVKNWCLNSASLDNQRKGILASYQYTGDFLVLAYVGKNELGKEKATGLLVFGLNLKDKRPAFFGEEPETVTGIGTTPSSPSNPGNPTPNPPGPNPPGPNPPDDPEKDPSKLTSVNTEPNDNTGPGENTIDPSDYNHSSKDRNDNSTSYSSVGEYQNWINHLGDVNETQRTGGDSNQPSTETPTNTNVDNNGATGTGYGSADTPTPVSDPAHAADTGQTINTNPGKAWEGPAD